MPTMARRPRSKRCAGRSRPIAKSKPNSARKRNGLHGTAILPTSVPAPWREKTYLVEAKWTQQPAAGREFGAFDYKIRGKTVDTRGLFGSINGYSPEAITGMNGKGELRIICIDGTHLMHALSSDDGLAPLLERLWRHANETGEAYLPAASL